MFMERPMRLVVVETWEGPCAVGSGTCRVCGWSGVDAFNVGLVRGELDGDWTFDGDTLAQCPRCELHEVDVDLTPPVAAQFRDRAPPESP